jgi:hypothetical protein
MTTAVLVVWAVSLIIALILTLVAVVLLIRVIRTAREINALAGRTLPAAKNIAANTAAIKGLEATKSVGGQILSTAKSIDGAAGSIERTLTSLATALGQGGK